MKPKDAFHDTLDIDQSLVKTFLALFYKPDEVVENPDRYMKPWKYATYIVSISSLFFWFVVHLVDNPVEKQLLWNIPGRVVDLLNGQVNFYETTQPLKRLLLMGISLYVTLLILFYPHRRRLPSIVLFVVGHSNFIVFLLQGLRIVLLGGGFRTIGDAYLGITIHVVYLTYAGVRIFWPFRWYEFFKVPVAIAVPFFLYASGSTLAGQQIYYGVMKGGDNQYQLQSSGDPPLSQRRLEKVWDTLQHKSVRQPLTDSIGQTVYRTAECQVDTLQVALDYSAPAGEVSKVMVDIYERGHQRLLGRVVVYEKIDRYSPNPEKLFVRFDTLHTQVIIGFRVPTAGYSTWHIACVDWQSARLIYNHTIKISSDDFVVYDMALHDGHVLICGSAISYFKNFDLAFVLELDQSTGRQQKMWMQGDAAFSSRMSFQRMRVKSDTLHLLVRRRMNPVPYFKSEHWEEWRKILL